MASKADAVIIDLEDSVPPAEKSAARETAARKLESAVKCRVLIRVNALDSPFFNDDLEVVLMPGLNGLMVPKVDDEESILHLHDRLCAQEIRRQLESIPVLALIESARAVAGIHRILQAVVSQQRLQVLAFGAADYTSDLGIAITSDGLELAYPRARLAVASRAAGLLPPLDTPFMLDLKDLQALEGDALRARQMGFGGKLCIHPNQVEVVNRIFSPRPEDVRQAEAVVSAFEEAQKNGVGAIQLNGKFIDKPVMERARQILMLARSLDA